MMAGAGGCVGERRCARERSVCFGEYVGVCRGCAGADEVRFRGAQMPGMREPHMQVTLRAWTPRGP
jgi:hypothetical protein